MTMMTNKYATNNSNNNNAMKIFSSRNNNTKQFMMKSRTSTTQQLQQNSKAKNNRTQIVRAVFERFTERAIKAVMLAQLEAKENKFLLEVTPACLILGLMVESKDVSENGFLKTGVSVGRARDVLKDIASSSSSTSASSAAAVAKNGGKPIAPGKKSSSGSSDVPFSKGSKVLFQQALELSESLNVGYIAPEHLCIVACNTFDDDEIVMFFEKLGIDRTVLRNAANAKLQADSDMTSSSGSNSSSDFSSSNNNNNGLQAKRPYQSNTQNGRLTQDQQVGVGAAAANGGEANKSALASFSFDLTEKARLGQVDPVIGRDFEVERCVQVLARRSKNNPILLGEPGVGKTAIAEGLAMRIVSGNVPEFLLSKKVCSLDIGLIMAGAKERGELEQRVKNIL